MATRNNIVSFDDAKRGRTSVRSVSPGETPRRSSGSQKAAPAKGRTASGQAASRAGRPASASSRAGKPATAKSPRSVASGRTAKPASSAAKPRSSARSQSRADVPRRQQPRQGSSRQAPAKAAEQQNKAFFDDLAERHQKKKRASAKERAERQFDRTYGKSERAKGAAPEEAGPRAAVYKGEMGRSHKRSSESLKNGSKGARSAAAVKGGEPKRGNWKKHLARLGASVAVVALACVVLYDPARMYYQEIREVARLQAEYDAIVARNDSLQASVDRLSTEEGIADEARDQLGWVNPGENAVNVSGLDAKESAFQANVVSDQVEPPETWYSPFLDPFFGVE